MHKDKPEGKMKNVWIIIAAYNEERVIESVIKDVLKQFSNVVVVNDHSLDNTAAISLKAGANVINHPINLGQGAALQTGIDYALKMGGEIFVTYDADGQHRVEDAISLVNSVINHECDFVCGSRFLGIEAKNIPCLRRYFLRSAAIFTRLTTGVHVTDAHNGLRAFSRLAAQSIRIKQNRMAHASEIISQVGINKIKYKEKPVEIIYTSYSISKGQKLSNSINILTDLFLGRFSK